MINNTEVSPKKRGPGRPKKVKFPESEVSAGVESIMKPKKPRRGKAGTIEGLAAIANEPYIPSTNNPRHELKRLVSQHRAWTRKATSIAQMASDRKNRATGETIPCDVPLDVRVEMSGVAKHLKGEATRLETAMLRELKKLDVYNLFLEKVYGVGPVVAAYLVANVDVSRKEKLGQGATKVSAITRYLGLAVINGRMERPVAGQKLGCNTELRTRLYQAMTAMVKNAAKRTADRPNGTNSKYLQILRDYKHRMHTGPRYDASNNTLATVNPATGDITYRKGAKAVINGTAWRKAATVLAEDLYIVWRAIEGLPVWPSYYSAKLGYEHGGKICVNEPKMLTVEEALAHVGDVGGVPATVPVEDVEVEPDHETEMCAALDSAAE